MAHIYRMSEWAGSPNCWYVNDVEEMGTSSSKWWMAIRMLNITPEDYVKLLTERFHACIIKYHFKEDVLVFSFRSQQEARNFKNYMNAEARKRHFICGK